MHSVEGLPHNAHICKCAASVSGLYERWRHSRLPNGQQMLEMLSHESALCINLHLHVLFLHPLRPPAHRP